MAANHEPERRKFLKYLGLGGIAAVAATMAKSTAKAAPNGISQVTRIAAYYNATSDWMSWAQIMNDNPDANQVKLSVYNLPGELIYETALSLNPYQTQTVPVESLTGVKGKQGMVVLASEEGKKLAAYMMYRKASQPDHTTEVIPFSSTLLSAQGGS
jgi:hypothetical protein